LPQKSRDDCNILDLFLSRFIILSFKAVSSGGVDETTFWFSSLRAVGLIHPGVAVDSMATRRVSISEEAYRSLQAEGLVTGESPGAVLERCILNGVSQKAREVLTTIGQPSATVNGKKGNLATKQPARCGALLDNDSR